jgi:hypothetical protein
MGTWGADNFASDMALDFINEQVDHYVGVMEEIFGDEGRFRLDEDAEGMLMPSVEILILLCEQCHGVLSEGVDVAGWKARYLAMYDDQIDGLDPALDFKQERRAVIAATFDKLLHWQAAHGRRQ